MEGHHKMNPHVPEIKVALALTGIGNPLSYIHLHIYRHDNSQMKLHPRILHVMNRPLRFIHLNIGPTSRCSCMANPLANFFFFFNRDRIALSQRTAVTSPNERL